MRRRAKYARFPGRNPGNDIPASRSRYDAIGAAALAGCTLFLASWSVAGASAPDGPSFDCSKVEAGSIESLVCSDAGLSALDRQLAQAYAEATKIAVNEHPPVLKAEQRGWIKGRDECWKSDDRRACVETEYKRRIAELQARYRLVPPSRPYTFICDTPTPDAPGGSEVIVTYFRTDPPTLIAERGDSVSLMYIQPSGSGARYAGRNESFWEHQGEAVITWGHGAPEMRCRLKP